MKKVIKNGLWIIVLVVLIANVSAFCFPPGTQISMWEGSTKNIEDIQFGEKVISYNTDTGEKEPGIVGDVSAVMDELFILNDGLIEVSDQHPFYTMKPDGSLEWCVLNKSVTIAELPDLYFVEELEIGDKIFTENGRWVPLVSIVKRKGEFLSYNLLNVGEHKNYYAEGLLVHNEGGDGIGADPGDSGASGSDGADAGDGVTSHGEAEDGETSPDWGSVDSPLGGSPSTGPSGGPSDWNYNRQQNNQPGSVGQRMVQASSDMASTYDITGDTGGCGRGTSDLKLNFYDKDGNLAFQMADGDISTEAVAAGNLSELNGSEEGHEEGHGEEEHGSEHIGESCEWVSGGGSSRNTEVFSNDEVTVTLIAELERWIWYMEEDGGTLYVGSYLMGEEHTQDIYKSSDLSSWQKCTVPGSEGDESSRVYKPNGKIYAVTEGNYILNSNFEIIHSTGDHFIMATGHETANGDLFVHNPKPHAKTDIYKCSSSSCESYKTMEGIATWYIEAYDGNNYVFGTTVKGYPSPCDFRAVEGSFSQSVGSCIPSTMENYDGYLFVGQGRPAKVYKFDGSTLATDLERPENLHMGDFEEYKGDLYVSFLERGGSGEIWRKHNHDGEWQQLLTRENLAGYGQGTALSLVGDFAVVEDKLLVSFVDPSKGKVNKGYILHIDVSEINESGEQDDEESDAENQTTSEPELVCNEVSSGTSVTVPSFVDTNNGTIRDANTELYWLKNVTCLHEGTMLEAIDRIALLEDGMCGLSDDSSAGDWRLPNIREILTVLDYTTGSLSGSLFDNVYDNYSYWSSTKSYDALKSWVVNLSSGRIDVMYRTTQDAFIWPVRDGGTSVLKTGQTSSSAAGDDGSIQAGIDIPSPRYTAVNGTVFDNATGLTWLKDAECFDLMNYSCASTMVNILENGTCGLADGSHAGDWRMPTIQEMMELLHYGGYSPALGTHLFDNVRTDRYYWSETGTDATSKWVLNFGSAYYTSVPENVTLLSLPVKKN